MIRFWRGYEGDARVYEIEVKLTEGQALVALALLALVVGVAAALLVGGTA